MNLRALRDAAAVEAVATALRDAGGSITAAAAALRTTRPALSRFLRNHPEAWPDGTPRRAAGRPRGGDVTDDALRAAVAAAGPGRGRWTRAARAVGLHPATARSRAIALGL